MRISNRKRILITGGAGFLGSHLCERLLAEGNDVLCVDNFYSGTKDNVAHLMGNPHFELMRHDVTFPLYVEVDEIYNLACPASPIHYQWDPVQTTKTSVHGAINMLGLAKRTKAKIFQASTSEVYGDPEVHPQPESYWGKVNPIGIRSCYDEGKRCAETLFFDYHRQHQVQIKVARIFNTYGPAHAPQRRPRGEQLHRAGPARRRPHDLRRRLADTQFLLCRRPDRRLCAPDGQSCRGDRPDQPGQSQRIHHPGTGRSGAEDGRRNLQGWSSTRCRRTIPSSASPTSHWPRPTWTGSPPSSCDAGLDKTIHYFRHFPCSNEPSAPRHRCRHAGL